MAKDVKTITDASEAVAEVQPGVVVLSDGTRVVVKQLSWMRFVAVYESIQGIMIQTISNGGEMNGLENMPHALANLVLNTTDMEDITELPFGDVFAVASEACRLNFYENRGVLDFFGGWMRAIAKNLGNAG